MKAVLPHVPPHQEAQPAQQDEGHGGEVDQRVVYIVGEGAVRLPEAHQVEARVAKGGYAVENGVPQPPGRPQLRDEADGQQQRARPLDQGGAPQDVAQQGAHVAQALGADALHHHRALAQAQLFAHEQGGLEHHGHISQPAHLDERKQDNLSQEIELGPGIRHHKAGDAGGGGGGEQAVQKGQALSAAVGDGQHQQQGPGQDDGQKAQGKRPVRGQRAVLCLHKSSPPSQFLPTGVGRITPLL